ncbi:hypothetical protein [Streptomyces griseorubiginosus]|uniref:Carboxypeptidase regulatory-like domain-containing protein n=1 Tax=Streptomyces griseorubiginosus TaxID=67304 RepID=A0A101S570_9ACTN|nr:hypothetical protein [Streptomyces griseorubiginosus]KUN67536.1 hypothetical protein AQJ54_13315 [Streptomyces griseorubiginosus]
MSDDDLDDLFTEEALPDEELALDLLEEELRQATAILDPVPAALRQIAVEAFALHDLDSRIAELSFDSVVDALPVRGGPAAPRMLTFHAGEVTVDVELTAQGLMGQVLPPRSARIEVLSGPQPGAPLTTDDMGRFTCEVPPTGPFALRLRTDEEVIVTDWLTV